LGLPQIAGSEIEIVRKKTKEGGKRRIPWEKRSREGEKKLEEKHVN